MQVRDAPRPLMNVFYDEAGAIGQRYRRKTELQQQVAFNVAMQAQRLSKVLVITTYRRRQSFSGAALATETNVKLPRDAKQRIFGRK